MVGIEPSLCAGELTSRRLDKGEGKDLSLPECSREQLEKEVCARIDVLE